MKRTAILVIAASNQPVYIHYIKTYWSELIEHTRREKPHIDVFLLFEHTTDLSEYGDLAENIIQEQATDYSQLCEPAYHTPIIPGILSKTIYALEDLLGKYDVYFRTNLSSVINLPRFEAFVNGKTGLCYSGGWAWVEGLRQDLLKYNRVGADKSIQSLSQLDRYPGNTFISGSGYFLNSEEARSLIEHKHDFRYDIVDDVSVGLMLARHEVLPGFSLEVTPDHSVPEMIDLIQSSEAGHIRLQRFPLDRAISLWPELRNCDIW